MARSIELETIGTLEDEKLTPRRALQIESNTTLPERTHLSRGIREDFYESTVAAKIEKCSRIPLQNRYS